MTKDEQEALSRKYSTDVWHILELSSGHIALFDHVRDLVCIYRPLAINLLVRYMMRKPVVEPKSLPKGAPPAAAEINLEELGL